MAVMAMMLLIAIGLLIYAGLRDLAVRAVPNWLSLCLLSIGLLVRWLDHSMAFGLAVCAATFVVLFGVWLAGAVGGGDVKLWAATALLIPPLWRSELAFFLHVIVLGGLLAVLYLLLYLAARKARPASKAGWLRRVLRAEAWRISRRAPLPYALAISGSAILTLAPLIPAAGRPWFSG